MGLGIGKILGDTMIDKLDELRIKAEKAGLFIDFGVFPDLFNGEIHLYDEHNDWFASFDEFHVDKVATFLAIFAGGEEQGGDPMIDLIVKDDEHAFGRPRIAGTNIPAEEVYERFMGGDSIETLAWDYERMVGEIEAAIRYCILHKEAL